ncbi:hypothetical protein ABB37_06662 [Leptomonas pyrrhocoris]|uniref:RING-type domain-containing protein n=1 Tax=Leptomonas pyrrhocoris TaxID=157538 RepID=A0A0M9FX26_LEPPY|nr:hypothetical protein ABB37_06662 [Leptomonas pyrrhocoris]KPA77860.1 hypothetical protein ABB37_06662 [Leptomonas pyrrhocoris]|eukprot:XP_015656299.1 hypothetical protein ABB37_06662 [Leptomonas pyrrhocoris]
MSQPATSSGGVATDGVIIPIETKYMYITAMSVPRETMIMKDSCAVCNGSLGHPCVNCNSVLDDCPVVIGACRHAFHQHCFERWEKAHGTCPTCQEAWQQERIIRAA